MEIISIQKSSLIVDPIRVTVGNVGDATDDQILDFACAAVGETRGQNGSLFGARLYRYEMEEHAVAVLDRD